MKNPEHAPKILKAVFVSLLAFLFIISCCSCKSFERLTEKEKVSIFKDVDKSLERMDSIFQNGAINDKFTIPIPQANTGDSEKDAALNSELLDLVKRLSTQKSSGANSYRVGVNDNNELFVKAFIAGTQSVKSTEVKKDSITSVSEKESELIDKTKVYVYPWWIYAIVIGVTIYVVIRLTMLSSQGYKWLNNLLKAINNDN